MAIGYTSLHLARAVRRGWFGGHHRSERRDDQGGDGYLTRAGLRERVRIERGKALDVIRY